MFLGDQGDSAILFWLNADSLFTRTLLASALTSSPPSVFRTMLYQYLIIDEPGVLLSLSAIGRARKVRTKD